MTSTDQNRNLVAAISYLLWFVTGIVILLVEADDKYIRFHAMQSTILFLGLFILNIIVGAVLGQIRFLGVLSSLTNLLILTVWFIVWVISMYQAYRGKVLKWPIVGKIAESRVR